MADWIVEGEANRTRIRIDPVRHLLVDDGHGRGQWALWCSSGKGRKSYNPHSRKFCRECLALANDAIADGTLSPSDVTGWPVTAAEPDDNGNMITDDERRAIEDLRRLARKWPPTLRLVSMDGNLSVVHADDPRYALDNSIVARQECILADIHGIPNDGGGW